MRTLLVLSLAASPALCLVRPMVALGSPQRAAVARPLPSSHRLTSPPTMTATSVLLTKAAPAAGVALANLMFLSPVKAVVDARKCGRLNDLNAVPFVARGNTVAWLGYSFMTRGASSLANWPGLLLGLYYTMTGVALGVKSSARSSRSSSSRTPPSSAPPARRGERRVRLGAAVLGLVAAALLLLYYSSPLSVVANVVRSATPPRSSGALAHQPAQRRAVDVVRPRGGRRVHLGAQLIGALLAAQLALGAFGEGGRRRVRGARREEGRGSARGRQKGGHGICSDGPRDLGNLHDSPRNEQDGGCASRRARGRGRADRETARSVA